MAPTEERPPVAVDEPVRHEWRTTSTGALVKVEAPEVSDRTSPFDFVRPQRRRLGLIGGAITAVLGVLALLVSLFTGGGGTSTQSQLERGVALQESGRLEEAAAAYRAVLADDPNDLVASYNLGVIAHTGGDLVTAEADYQRVLALDPNHVPALYNYALVQTANGLPAEAVALYRRALAVQPDHAPSMLNLGVLLLEQGGADAEASDLIARAVQLDPSLQGS